MSNAYATPTDATYLALEEAFNHFNTTLFEDRLPPVMITLTRQRGNKLGYFHAEQFVHRAGHDLTHEIALNPNAMGRTVAEVLSTLAHEMTHLEQEEYGTPGKRGNHNKEWGTLMDRIGLTPSNTGEPGGRRTGRQMTHYVEAGGRFEQALAALGADFDIPYFTQATGPAAKKKDLSKLKHTCPSCEARAWAKQGTKLLCGDCGELMEPE